MAQAIVRGLLKQGTPPEKIFCISKSGTTARQFAESTGIQCLDSPARLIESCDCLVLAFKPHQLQELRSELTAVENQLVLSVLAGTSLQKLRDHLPGAQAIVRTMPNTPGRIGHGMTAFCCDESLSESMVSATRSILTSLGQVVKMDESLMDVFTAVAGSGPAYVFEFIAALAEAGEAQGLSSDDALNIAKQTVFGAACLARESDEHPESLRDQVTSKGGTTQAGLESMANGQFRELIQNTVKAARERSIEMGKNQPNQAR